MTLVEAGLTDVTDPDFAGQLRSAQRNREIAVSGIERLRRRFNTEIQITAERVVQFTQFMKDRVRNGEIPYRKAYTRSVVDRTIVEDKRTVIKANTAVLQDLVSKPSDGGIQVPNAVPDW